MNHNELNFSGCELILWDVCSFIPEQLWQPLVSSSCGQTGGGHRGYKPCCCCCQICPVSSAARSVAYQIMPVLRSHQSSCQAPRLGRSYGLTVKRAARNIHKPTVQPLLYVVSTIDSRPSPQHMNPNKCMVENIFSKRAAADSHAPIKQSDIEDGLVPQMDISNIIS